MENNEIEISDQLNLKKNYFKTLFFPATSYCTKATELIVNSSIFIAGSFII